MPNEQLARNIADPQVVYNDVKDQWLAKISELDAIQSSIQDIEARLSSWSLSAWEAIGLGSDDVKQDQHLYILPNAKLSKSDLERKRSLLQDKVAELQAAIKGMQAVGRQLEIDARAEQAKNQAAQSKKEHAEYISEYTANSAVFFATVLFDISALSSKPKIEIYVHADKLIAIKHCITAETPKEYLWPAWKLVAKARDLSLNEPNHLDGKYLHGARQVFMHLINILPAGMQGLKFLYNARDYDRADYYLNEAYMSAVIGDSKEYLQLLNDLADEVELASKNIVRNAFSEIPKFNKLPKNVKSGLVDQQAYANQLLYDVSFAKDLANITEIEFLKTYAQQISTNVMEVINR